MTPFKKGIWASPITAAALVLVVAAPLSAQARLSPSVQRHVASKSAQPIDVIIRRSPDESRVDAKERVTHEHISRVQQYSVALARRMGANDEKLIKAIETASLVHDMGNLASRSTFSTDAAS